MTVKIIDKGYKGYSQAIKDLDKYVVSAGLFAKVGDEVLTKAIVNEFGTDNAGKNRNIKIAERSFVRRTFKNQYKKVARQFENIFKSIGKGDFAVERKLQLIGQQQSSEIKKTIIDLKEPPNSPITIAKKKSSNPLVDEGEMLSKVSYEVNKR